MRVQTRVSAFLSKAVAEAETPKSKTKTKIISFIRTFLRKIFLKYTPELKKLKDFLKNFLFHT